MQYTNEEMQSILELHRKWLYDENGGKKADLRGADLRGANLRGADLSKANLYGADLYGAGLSKANLYEADLYGANLRGANLYGANLYGADLRGANLYGADLYGADLRGADLRKANLYGADLSGAKNSEHAEALTVICPEGEIVGWKKALGPDGCVIVKLVIPKSAKRCNARGRKCRASKAKVVRIETIEGERLDCKAWSDYDTTFFYETGKVVEPTEPFDEDRWNECAPGIHFFITREEAVNYR